MKDTKLQETYPKIYQSFVDSLNQQLDLFSKKCIAYGVRNISLGTDLHRTDDKQLALQGVWIRMMDKMNRWRSLTEQGLSEANGESLIDTFQDMANYAIIAKMVMEGKWEE